MACEYVVKREKIKDKKVYKDVGDIPYGAGYQMVADEMYTQIDRLQKIGMGIWFLTHEKEKKFESRDGVSYDKVTLSLPNRARDLVVNSADFIIFIENVKIQDGDKVRDERIILLRSDGGEIEAGSRFKNIRDRVPYGAKNFLGAFEEAVLSEVGEGVDIDSLKEEQAEQREAVAKAYTEKATTKEVNAESLIGILNSKIKDMSTEDKKLISAGFKDILDGTANYTTVTDIDLLQQCLAFVESM
jgi:hypothetical protein